VNNEIVTLPMRNKIKTSIQVPPRSEIIQAISLHLKEDSIICNQEIIKGVFLANAIIPAKGIAHIKILHTCEHSIILSELEPEIHPLKEYHILDYTKNPHASKKRFQEIMAKLNLDGMDENAKTTIINICRKYQDIFHLDNERLTTKTFINKK